MIGHSEGDGLVHGIRADSVLLLKLNDDMVNEGGLISKQWKSAVQL